MMSNTLSLSQPWNSGAYNDHLVQKMQNPNASPQALLNQHLGQSNSVANSQNASTILDDLGFASELRSHKNVTAMLNLEQQTNGLAPTLGEKGAQIGEDGTVYLPQDTRSLPQQSQESNNIQQEKLAEQNSIRGIAFNTNQGISLQNHPKGLTLQNVRAFALDSRSLNILSRLTANPQKQDSSKVENIDYKEVGSSLLGKLSARYESASLGSAAIGYDRTGGTSYGTYQIASRTGTFDNFLKFLDREAPDWANTLREAGSANTGSRKGAMPDAWKSLVEQDPERMKHLEHQFIVESHYQPVADYVEKNWSQGLSEGLKEVIFSTSVQHGVGGAKKVFEQAFADTKLQALGQNLEQLGTKMGQSLGSAIGLNTTKANDSSTQNTLATTKTIDPIASDTELIHNVYAHRATKFGSSTQYVQEAVQRRFQTEKIEAIKLLG